MKYWLTLSTFLVVLSSSANELFIVVDQKITQTFSKKEIQSFFLKKNQYWPNNKKIRPIDQALGSPAREVFLKEVMGKSEIEMSEYWIEQKQVNGIVQPIQLESNAMVLRLVESLPGSIGYILTTENSEKKKSKLRWIQI